MKHAPAAHKSGTAGQIVNPIPEEMLLKDYLIRKYPEEMKKKLSFEEWWESFDQVDYDYVLSSVSTEIKYATSFLILYFNVSVLLINIFSIINKLFAIIGCYVS